MSSENTLGVLLLPSLHEDRHIIIENLNESEATAFIDTFTLGVLSNRKLSTPKKQIPDTYQTYNLLDDEEEYFDHLEMAEELAISTVPKHRGRRAVFINYDTNGIIVGTAVVYNKNWAMIGFDDDTLPESILDFT